MDSFHYFLQAEAAMAVSGMLRPCHRAFLVNFCIFCYVCVFRFFYFVHVKPLDESSLAEIVKHVWWDNNGMDQTVEENKAPYFIACQKIREAVAGNQIILQWRCYWFMHCHSFVRGHECLVESKACVCICFNPNELFPISFPSVSFLLPSFFYRYLITVDKLRRVRWLLVPSFRSVRKHATPEKRKTFVILCEAQFHRIVTLTEHTVPVT
jgi:hypothetical protein